MFFIPLHSLTIFERGKNLLRNVFWSSSHEVIKSWGRLDSYLTSSPLIDNGRKETHPNSFLGDTSKVKWQIDVYVISKILMGILIGLPFEKPLNLKQLQHGSCDMKHNTSNQWGWSYCPCTPCLIPVEILEVIHISLVSPWMLLASSILTPD